MLTLVTGEPGNGKTAYVLAQLLELQKASARPLFVWGIPDLAIPHEVCPPLSEWTHVEPVPEDPSLTQAVFSFPSGSLIVIDECQTVYRVRGATAKVPPYVAALETHRHLGLDFFLITQKPELVDRNVRALVGKHVHLKSNWAGRRLLEWSECRNPLSRTDCSEAVTRKYHLPKSVFGLYKSATEHIKPTRRLPKQLAVAAAALLLVVAGVVYARMRFAEMTAKPAVAAEPPHTPARAEAAVPAAKATVTAKEDRDTPLRLISYVFIARAGEVLHRYFYAECADGSKIRIPGDFCTGEGRDAQCVYSQKLISFRS